MKRKRYSEAEIIAILKEHEAGGTRLLRAPRRAPSRAPRASFPVTTRAATH
jgi:hypothetical protein